MKLLTETQKPNKPGEYNIWFSNIRSVMPMFAHWDGDSYVPRGLAGDDGNGPMHTNYGFVIGWLK